MEKIMVEEQPVGARAGRNRGKVTEVETYGIERIPEKDRNASAFDLFRVSFGGANTFATAFLGAFPILFGLSFWQGLAATVTGLVVGALLLAPMAVFGPTNGTNNAVSSSAHLGVHGRVVGSFLSLLTALAFFSISVWSSGDALVGGLNRLVGLPQDMGSFAVAYGLFGGLVLVVCVYGFKFMLLVNKIAVTAATLLFVVGFIAFAGDLNLNFEGAFGTGFDGVGIAGFIPAFIGAALIVMSNPISFGAFLGDWARYIPTATPKRRVMGAALLAQLATLIPFVFGLATASIIATKAPEFMDPTAPNYVGGLLAISPAWYFVPLCAIALIGGMSTGASSLYGTGLDFSSVFPRFNRVQATLFIGTLAIVFIFAGRFAFNLVQSISTFATLIVTCTAPWMVVMIIGFITRRGWYDADALQVFNRRQSGGRYWFNHGWNLRGMAAWLVSAAAGLSLVNMPGQFQGPLGNLAGGVDISLPASVALAAVLYLGLLWIFPEPRAVFPAAGPRWIPSKDTAVPPVIDAAGNTVPAATHEAAAPGLPGDRDPELVSQR